VLVDPEDESCGRVTFSHPEEAEVSPKPGFKLLQDSEYELFKKRIPEMLTEPSNLQSRLTATFEGRFDWAFWPWQGFGHLNMFKARLVVHRVRGVEATSADVHPR